ncbi:hypothetical protein [Aciditerrimonas ferrireducens]|uniref:hypothetical protein n=1 Tax=Aciditerrimonas ferrireducens TaxID=667306 RepID=UPI0020053E11|nr:hypothetical protein [Aciditerrimonas ferrireducens]MCK4177302.1 hypothetical protein [Aciditerrimonas ferrireducens]
MGKPTNGGKRLARRTIQGGMAAVGALGLAAGMAGVAGAQTNGGTQSITDTFDYTCTVSTPAITLTDQTATVVLDVTAPQEVSPGQSFTVQATSQTTLPSIIAATASGLGITSVTVQSVKAEVDATNVTPTSTTDTNTQTPTVTTSELTSPISVALAPLSFTAGNTPGTATFTAGDITVVSVISGGSLNGDDATLTCTPPSNNTIGTVDIVSSGTSTVPVGAVGGAALAGLLGVGGGVAYVVRRRRTSPVANGIR